jgi:hypothetical protein
VLTGEDSLSHALHIATVNTARTASSDHAHFTPSRINACLVEQ